MPKNIICISHVKDTDGICSAAIVKMARKANIMLADYGDLSETLAQAGNPDELYICDLGLSEKTFGDFLEHTSRIARRGSVEYIDHHPLKEEFRKKIEASGVKVMHSTDEACAVLTYLRFRENIPRKASVLAAFGAIGDHMDFRPEASTIIENHDRLFLLFEATILSHALAIMTKNRSSLPQLVQTLSERKLPHQIDKLVRYAAKQASVVSKLASKIERDGKKMSNLAWAWSDQSAGGTVANLLLGAFDASVGVALRKEEGFVELSARASSKCGKNLGEVISSLASEMGGFGGGHPRASGARILAENTDQFLTLLNERLGD